MMKSIVFCGPIRNDLSGLPYGFWVGIAPRDAPVDRYASIPFRLKIGVCWYAWWKIAVSQRPQFPWLPRFQFEFA